MLPVCAICVVACVQISGLTVDFVGRGAPETQIPDAGCWLWLFIQARLCGPSAGAWQVSPYLLVMCKHIRLRVGEGGEGWGGSRVRKRAVLKVDR